MADQVFVARERELNQLNIFLGQALAGHGQVCFVTGEAGAGKTALVTEFARRAQQQYDDLLVAIGVCNAQTGIGDPCLPFRHVLGMLTADVEGRLAQGAISRENASRLESFLRLSGQALVEYGPDLIDIFVPGGALATRVAGRLAQRVGWMDRLDTLIQRKAQLTAEETGLEQSHIFQQYTNVLTAMAEEQPIWLLLDDLQWADAASISLLFHLGRSIQESRILIIGAYRPDEVTLGRPSTDSGGTGGERHPLEKVLTEFKRYYGDIWVNLDQDEEVERRQFVDAYLDTEPNRLGEEFREPLYRHTSGHALFTTELLRNMQERGDLIQDEEGRWVVGPKLKWDSLPARIEGVIEERIGRLEEELRQTLTVASVEGEEFTAEVIARVQAVDERGLVRRLSRELDKQHHLVGPQAVQRLGRQRLSLYRFRHNLFRKYLYEGLDEVERSYLHEDVGVVLEELYGEQVDEACVPLARHFEAAGIEDKARHYLYRAGEQARRGYAHAEAVNYLNRALELTPETEHVERYAVLAAREKAYDMLGAREAQHGDLVALEELAEMLDDNRRRVEVALRRVKHYEVTGDYPVALAAAQQAVALAQAAGVVEGEASAHLWCGRVLWRQADYPAAGEQLEAALELARATGLRGVEADSLRTLGSVVMFQGDYDGARDYFEQALLAYGDTSDRRGALNNLGIVAMELEDYAEARAYFEQALGLYRRIGDRYGESIPLSNLGDVALRTGDYARARGYFEQALDLHREVGDRLGEGIARHLLGDVAMHTGDYLRARACFEQALGLFRELGKRWFESAVLGDLGLLFHRLGDDEAAREHSQQALRVAQNEGERYLEGHALTILGHALVGLGRVEKAGAAYRDALGLRRELDLPNLAMESLAGLAYVSLTQEALSQAQTHVEEILANLETGPLHGTHEPFRVYVTCYRVLKTNQDPRAKEVLATAYNLLQEQAANFDDEEMRRSFLENVPSHREIIREWQAASDK